MLIAHREAREEEAKGEQACGVKEELGAETEGGGMGKGGGSWKEG